MVNLEVGVDEHYEYELELFAPAVGMGLVGVMG
jgi:hypothetical protein